MSKATNAEIQLRLDEVLRLVVLGERRAGIVRFASEKQWGVSDRQIDNYIARANEMLREELEPVRAREFTIALRRMNLVFTAAMRVQDYQRAIAAQQEINKLIGLYAPTRNEMTGANGGPVQIETRNLPPLAEDTIDHILANE